MVINHVLNGMIPPVHNTRDPHGPRRVVFFFGGGCQEKRRSHELRQSHAEKASTAAQDWAEIKGFPPGGREIDLPHRMGGWDSIEERVTKKTGFWRFLEVV